MGKSCGAVRNVYLVESDTGHDLLPLLGLALGAAEVEVQAQASSREDWQNEARLRELLAKVLRERAPGGKLRQQLYEYATCYHEPVLAGRLVEEAGFDAAQGFLVQRDSLGRKHYLNYFAWNFKDILQS